MEQKRQVDEQGAAIAEELGGNRVVRMISEEDTRALLGNLSAGLQRLDCGHVKARLRALLSKIEVDPATLTARIYYAIPAATGIVWRPHGDAKPGYSPVPTGFAVA